MSSSKSSTAGEAAEKSDAQPLNPEITRDVEKQEPAPENIPGGPPEAGDHYKPRSLKFWLIMLSNFLAMFLVALDRTIISTAIPRITDEFHSQGEIGWYGSAYMLATSASQLLFGRIYKYYNMKWIFLSCVVLFEVGSAICGAAPNSPTFIVGRAIAGLASAGIFTGSIMAMIPMIPLHKRPMFQGMFGMVFGIASVMGPLVGGGFTGAITWRWCFYINLPIGAVTLVFMFFFWNPPQPKHEPASLATQVKRLDPLGMFFYLPAVVCLLLALQWGGSTYPWNDGRIIALFVVFGVLTIGFVAVQHFMPKTATIPARIIGQRSIISAACFTFTLAGAMLMSIYYLPLWFQAVKGVSPLHSGIYTIPLVLSLVVASLLSAIITQKIGYYVPSMILSPAIMAVGEAMMGTFNTSTDSPRWIGYQVVAGFGLGFGMQTANLAVQTVLPMTDVSTGISILFFLQQLGGAVFTSVGQNILSNILVSRLAGIPGLDPQSIIDSGATELPSLVPAQYLGQVIDAYNYACTRIFFGAVGLSLCSLLASLTMEWRSIKKGRQNHGGSGGGNGGPGSGKGADSAPAGTTPAEKSSGTPEKPGISEITPSAASAPEAEGLEESSARDAKKA